jgi:hypothetical protein
MFKNKLTPKIDINGNNFWKLNGLLHRKDGPAVEWTDGTKFWFLNGRRHREDGSAVEWADDSKEWFLNNLRHREDGPACEWANGVKSWYLNGKKYSFQDYIKKLKEMGKSDKEIMLIALKYG